MSTATFELHAPAAESDVSIETGGRGLLAPLKRVIDAFREANAERALRQAWAQLDPSVLRDLGIGADEIPRVRAAEDFTPRNWIG